MRTNSKSCGAAQPRGLLVEGMINDMMMNDDDDDDDDDDDQ